MTNHLQEFEKEINIYNESSDIERSDNQFLISIGMGIAIFLVVVWLVSLIEKL